MSGEPNSLKRKHTSASIAADVKRFCHQINTDEVFDTHNYATWRVEYDGHEKSRVSAVITNGRVFRSADQANEVVALQDVADVAKARTWLGSKAMKSVMEKSGVLGTPSIRFAAAA